MVKEALKRGIGQQSSRNSAKWGACVGGRLHYDMIADTPEMIEAMRRIGRPPAHVTRTTFVEVKPHEHLVITHVIDFLPGRRTDFFASGDAVRMVVTLEPMHNEEFTRMSGLGFSSQLTKLDKRFELRTNLDRSSRP